MKHNLLILLFILPLLGIFIYPFLQKTNIYICDISLIIIGCCLWFSIILWIIFDKSVDGFQGIINFNFCTLSIFNLIFGIDGLSILLILLTNLLVFLCLIYSIDKIKKYSKLYICMFLLLDILCVFTFCILDLFFFYILFESILIPLFIIIGIWGTRLRKIKAAYQLFIYTLFGSICFLLAIIFISFEIGTTDYQYLSSIKIEIFWTEKRKILIWLALFFSFAVKIPMIPLHLWLPEAHVEAPTTGSVLLAGIILKLGIYAVVRFLISLLPITSSYFSPFILVLSLISLIFASLTTLRQTDCKKILAYSSIAHMNTVILGFFSLNIEGISGGIILMISHGIISSALFFLIGILYDRYGTRNIKYYSSISQRMPCFAFLMVYFTLANISLPGTSNFIGELIILIGLIKEIIFVGILCTFILGINGAASIWLLNRILFGYLTSINLV